MGELAITRAFGDKSFKMGIKAMLEEDTDDLGGNHENEQAKDLTAPLVSAEPEIASMVCGSRFWVNRGGWLSNASFLRFPTDFES
jgi:hypothetical protein